MEQLTAETLPQSLGMKESLGGIHTLPEIEGGHKVAVYQDSSIDASWFEAQTAYIKQLSKEDKELLRGFTDGFDSIANAYLRTNADAKTLMKILREGWEEVAPPFKDATAKTIVEITKKYIADLNSIFDKAPLLKKELRLFRGRRGKSGSAIASLNGFVSTTYAPSDMSFEEFTQDGCCILELLVKPGVHALCIQSVTAHANEFEVILPPNITFAVVSESPVPKKVFHYPTNTVSTFNTYTIIVSPPTGGKRATKRRRYPNRTYRRKQHHSNRCL